MPTRAELMQWAEDNLFGERTVKGVGKIPLTREQQAVQKIAVAVIEKWEQRHSVKASDIKMPDDLTYEKGRLVPRDPKFIPAKVCWKDEGRTGPIWLETTTGEIARGEHWATRAQAVKIAKKMNLPFEDF